MKIIFIKYKDLEGRVVKPNDVLESDNPADMDKMHAYIQNGIAVEVKDEPKKKGKEVVTDEP